MAPGSNDLALDGGTPVRHTMLPHGRQYLDDQDIKEMTEVLRSDWRITGPTVEEFEADFAKFASTDKAVAVCNGTAAPYVSMYGLNIGRDEVIAPAMTFAATANCVLFQGGTPVIGDVDPDTLSLDSFQIEEKITSRTNAIIAVDYAAQPCEYDLLRTITYKYKHAP